MTEERTGDTAPFAFIVMDMFSPFVTKEGKKELKRYGAVFTCLSSRAIRLEAVHSVETVPFIMCMWRFIECCGNMKMLRYDNDSNFIATEKELNKDIVGMDHSHIRKYQSREERNKPRRNLEIVSVALLKTCTDIGNHFSMENVANHETDKNSLV